MVPATLGVSAESVTLRVRGVGVADGERDAVDGGGGALRRGADAVRFTTYWTVAPLIFAAVSRQPVRALTASVVSEARVVSGNVHVPPPPGVTTMRGFAFEARLPVRDREVGGVDHPGGRDRVEGHGCS